MKYLLCGAMLVSSVFPFHAQEDFALTFTMEKEEYLLGEPIFITAELTNISGSEKTIPFCDISYPNTLRLVIEDEKGRMAGHLYGKINIVGGDRTVKKLLKRDEKITVSIDAIRRYELFKQGKYSMFAIYKNESGGNEEMWEGEVRSAKKTITIKEPTDEKDKQIVRIIGYGPTFRYFDEQCERILKISTTSTYSRYARFFLAESNRRWMEGGARTYVKKAFDEAMELYTKVIEEKFILSDDAQLGIAKCYVIKEDYETAAKEAQKVIDTYPDSNSVEDAKKLLKEIETKRVKKDIETPRKKE